MQRLSLVEEPLDRSGQERQAALRTGQDIRCLLDNQVIYRGFVYKCSVCGAVLTRPERPESPWFKCWWCRHLERATRVRQEKLEQEHSQKSQEGK
ncbi:MAG TPA: hypothetical protein VH186_11770 [Chloroflexia bacterium]|nr:hypothetical protein [Chloroflexia bacterium]